jgi:hypothetical protein
MNLISRKKSIMAAILSLFVLAPMLAIAQVAWVKDFDAALKQAARENKFIVLDISASW